MQSTNVSAHERLERKIASFISLKDGDLEALRRLPLRTRKFGAREDVIVDGARASECCLLVEGLLHRYKLLPDGTRSILSYHVPGEIPDLQTLFLTTMDHSLGTVVASEVSFIAHSAISALMRERPDLAYAFWRQTLIDAALFRAWIVNLGARPARARIAHLLCELFVRLTSVELAEEDGFTLSLSQLDIAEATGLSAVHVNRSIQELRAERLIASEGKFLRILDWARLKHISGFESSQLHLRQQARGA